MPKAPHLPDDGKEMYGTVFEVLKKNSFLTVEQAMEVYFENCCTYLNHEQIKEIIWNCAKYISIKIRRYYKLQIMHTLESTGAVIEIYGDNWEDNEKGWGENVHIHKRVSSYECNRLLGNAKIGLNCMPWYKDGCSERVFNIMLNGAVCLTDVSDYLLERFQQGKEVVFYELDDMDSLRENVVWLLQHPESAEKISKCGYDTAAVNDTWQKRMEKVLSFAQQDML
jgi:hypothetical protein